VVSFERFDLDIFRSAITPCQFIMPSSSFSILMVCYVWLMFNVKTVKCILSNRGIRICALLPIGFPQPPELVSPVELPFT